ncbi:MAG: 2Fe-2S iron-sulfur cluster-binding protein [Sphingobium sp.]
MATLTVTRRDGATHVIAAAEGDSAMTAIRDAGFDELLALCGGSCSCATCHVIVADDWIDRVGIATGDESDLLDGSASRCTQSRLSCQLKISSAFDGLAVTIAPQD